MSSMPSVIVKKGGFLSALCYGFFGLLTACVVCGTGLGFFAIHTFSATGGDVAAFAGKIIEKLPEWQKALPPALADAVNDERAPEYRDKVEVTVRALETRRDRRVKTLIEIKNNGDETISLMAIHASAESGGVPVGDAIVYVATPLAINDADWPGPLLPGSTRKLVRYIEAGSAEQMTAEIAELRVARDTPPSTATVSAAHE